MKNAQENVAFLYISNRTQLRHDGFNCHVFLFYKNRKEDQSFNELIGRGITIYFEMERLDLSETGKVEWSTSTIDRILSNEKYVGTVLSQKSYVVNCLTHKQVKNNGELPMYLMENNHEAIISKEVF